jgi:hypothetical protein
MPSTVSPKTLPLRRRLGPALGLFLLAPLVGEFLLGNLPITWLWVLPSLALLYGGGSLLIRELARRFGLGWPALVLLGLAFGVLEESWVTASLFNPAYLGLRLLDYGYLPGLGIGAWWTVYVLSLHAVWSTATPIGLVEEVTTGGRLHPWLGRPGLAITTALFLGGCALLRSFQPPAEVRASAAQLACSTLVIAALVVVAFAAGRRSPARRSPTPAPRPLVVGSTALVCGSAFMAVAAIAHAALPALWSVLAMLTLWAGLALALSFWSSRQGWGAAHRLAAVSGLLLTYVWYGFWQVPSVGSVGPLTDLLGNAVFAVGTLALLRWAWVRVGLPGHGDGEEGTVPPA